MGLEVHGAARTYEYVPLPVAIYTLYPVNYTPPLLKGGSHLNVMKESLLSTKSKFIGTYGPRAVIIIAEALLKSLAPALLTAFTLN